MQHREDNRVGQALGQRKMELRGAGRIERRSGLVEEQDVRLLQQHPCEHQPLLLAAGEHIAPGPAFVQLVVELADEAAEPGPRQHLGDRQRIELPGAARIGDLLFQRQPLGQIGLLRGQEHPRARGHRHPPLAIGPEPRDSLQERALAASARPADMQTVAAAQDQPRYGDERPRVMPPVAELEPLDRQHRTRDQRPAPEVADPGLGIEAVAVAHPFDRVCQLRQPRRIRPENGEL